MKKVFLTMACLFMVIALISCSGSAPKQLTDREILVKIYETMNGPNWKEADGENWNSDKPIEEWKGVKVNDEGRVISLAIQGDSLQGLIPAEIGGLTELEQLTIDWRELKMPNVIPAEIGKLTKLKVLRIRTFLYGSKSDMPEFPDLTTLVNLEDLFLSGFRGAIPENIGKLSKLHSLRLQGFEGEIPESICALTNLEKLLLTSTFQPENAVPDCIGKLSSLKFLTIDYSTGWAGGIEQPNAKFPESIWDLTNLEELSLRAISNTGGPIPGDKVAKMTHLKMINIGECGITGTIPAEFFTSDKLTKFSIYKNNLTGSIPAEVGNCVTLRSLSLNENQLTGKIPAELAKCVKLTVCDLSNNQLSPELPAALKAHPKFSNFKF